MLYCFSVKTWTIIKELCLCQHNMNGNEAIFFDTWKNNSVTFKQVIMHSETRNGATVKDETVIVKILNENQRCHHGKVLTEAN